MACGISINSVVLDPVTGNVIVQGTLNLFTACGGPLDVTVSITCGGQTYNVPASTQQDPLQPTLYTFTAIAQTNCPPNSTVTVVVTNNCPNYVCTGHYTGVLCGCPIISNITNQVGDCDVNGNRLVTLNATIAILQQSCFPVQVIWDFGDGNYGPAVTYNSPGTFSLSSDHTYSPGNYNAQLLTIAPWGCPAQSMGIAVPPCPTTCCPVITNNVVSVGDCDSNGEFTATFETEISIDQGCPGAVVQWSFGDGTNDIAQFFGQGTSVFPNTHTYNAGSAPYTATLNVISPSGCPGSSVIIDTPSTSSCNCVTSSLSWLCPSLWSIMTYGLGLAMVLILLATCPGLSAFANAFTTAAAITGSLAVLALIIYLLVCTNCAPCAWFYQLFWRIFFGVGVVYASFAACCGGPTAFFIGLVIMGLGILFLFLWANQCDKTLCQVLAEVLLTLGVYVLPTLGFLIGNSGISSCLFVVFTIFNVPVTFYAIVLAIIWLYIGLLSFSKLSIICRMCPTCGKHITQERGHFQALLSQKMGRCRFCMLMSLLGTLFSWGLFLLVISPSCQSCNSVVLVTLIGLAVIFFSVLFIAHAIKLYMNSRKPQ
jgi:hypothetical protein